MLCAVLIISSEQITAADSRPDDSLALVAFYNSTNGSSWTDHTNWLTDKPIDQWVGVTLNVAGRVIDLSLSNNKISGSIPKEIGNLTALDNLSLRVNSLKGTIPAEIGNLKQLTYMSLSSNELSGTLPSSLGDLTKLQYLLLADNYFTGSIPAEIGKLLSLTNLSLWGNKLSGSIPKEIGNLSSLQSLLLYVNELTDSIPNEIGNLTNLVTLELDDNQLSGEIPKEIGNLTNLRTLLLRINKLTGSITKEIGKLSNLTLLELEDNQLSGEIPKEIGNLTNLETLFLRTNQLSGSIPNEFGNLKKLINVSLRVNKLVGIIPAEFSQLTALKTLYINDNQLSGGLANLPKITFDSIFIFNNRFNFDELEMTVSAKNYRYAPQDSLGTSRDTTLNVKQELRLTSLAGTTTNINYQWYKNGIEIPFLLTNELVISSVKKEDEGVYTYQATNNEVINLTLYSRPVTVKVKEEVGGVEEDALSRALIIQPNPANTTVTVQLVELGASISSISVYDALGNSMGTIGKDLFTDRFTIDVANFTNGIYVIRANMSGTTITKQLVVYR